jgi:hypothetical protein
MNPTLEHALSLAERGFWIFPCRRNGKLPTHPGWQQEATRDRDVITQWFSTHPFNVGIFTGRFGDDKALVVVDVDTKKGKKGDQTLLLLENEGFDFPVTLQHRTPTGGQHLIYVCDEPLKGGVDVLGEGLDIRSAGQLIVGPGSEIDGHPYEALPGPALPSPAPAWLISRLGYSCSTGPVDRAPLPGVDQERAVERVIAYLKAAPVAVQDQGGDNQTFKVAAQCKDLGCDQDTTLDLMLEHWNDRCTPPWDADELEVKVRNAYKHGENRPGSAAPEAVFTPVEAAEGEGENAATPDPVLALNKEFALVAGSGTRVLRETTGPDGEPKLQHMRVRDFHDLMANRKIQLGDGKEYELSKLWMKHPERRTFDDLVFAPGKAVELRFYNMWRGFRVEPVDGPANHPALDMFLEHALKNVCQSDEAHCRWLLGWMAHLIQKPWEKPLVAVVFKGQKGTGKNALIERICWLLGPHAMVADSERYLTGNFNSHFESNLLFVADEATWAGNKATEGRLKGLITGTKHVIERKGLEPFTVDNLTRLAILSNETWVVPATHDERRFAVFEVGNGRRQDKAFFRAMREGMEQGGYPHLLRYLLDYDLTEIDVNQAPATDGLLNQKLASLRGPERFLAEIIEAGDIPQRGTSGFPQVLEWGDSEVVVPKAALYGAYVEASRVKYREHHAVGEGAFWKALGGIMREGRVALHEERLRGGGGNRERVVTFPSLSRARAAFNAYLTGG